MSFTAISQMDIGYTELIVNCHLLGSKLVFANFSVACRGVCGTRRDTMCGR